MYIQIFVGYCITPNFREHLIFAHFCKSAESAKIKCAIIKYWCLPLQNFCSFSGWRTDGRTDRQTDGRTLPSTLSPSFAVDITGCDPRRSPFRNIFQCVSLLIPRNIPSIWGQMLTTGFTTGVTVESRQIPVTVYKGSPPCIPDLLLAFRKASG